MNKLPTITFDEWIAELSKLSASSDGLSTAEIMARTGLCQSAVHKHIQRAILHGQLVFAGCRATLNVAGRMTHIPVYKPASTPTKT